jgi:hypothetical protein
LRPSPAKIDVLDYAKSACAIAQRNFERKQAAFTARWGQR